MDDAGMDDMSRTPESCDDRRQLSIIAYIIRQNCQIRLQNTPADITLEDFLAHLRYIDIWSST
jgi:hypothetical protein